MQKLLLVLVAVALAACGRASDSSTSAAPAAEPALSPTTAPGLTASTLPAGLVRVADASQVCMVNDQVMGTPQIPIAVEGRTYYGCCPMCKDRLANEPATRTAADPVTGEAVDKSRAVIVQDAAGKVLYFASEDTLRRYRG